MKIESPAFTMDDVRAFLDEMQNRDRHVLADRLQRASKRLAALAPRIQAGGGDGTEWSDHEVLAHIATLSKYYGVLVHRIVSGKTTELSLLEPVNLRDTAIQQVSGVAPAELLSMTLADHERTLKMLRSAAPASLRTPVQLQEGGAMTAEEVARLALVNHLEQHIDHLERSLG